MSSNKNLEDWNFQVLMLVQALIGAISPNFRMVTLDSSGGDWVIKFYLEKNIDEDLEEIEEVFCQYTAYQNKTLDCRHEIIVGLERLPGASDVGRVIYRRRE